MALALGVVLGGSQFANSNLTLALAQHHTSDAMRGRVMSLSLVAFVGIFPFTSYLLGSVASVVGSPATFVGCGAVCLMASLLATRWRRAIWIPDPASEGSAEPREAPTGRRGEPVQIAL
jgi:hypothetical protein